MAGISTDAVLSWVNRSTEVPHGYCRCGCGRQTSVAKYSDVSKGWKRGEPKGFCNGHASRKKHNLAVDSDTGCIIWQAYRQPNGYGRLGRDGVNSRGMAHVVVYEKFINKVPEGKELDHKCRNRACINPNHLEPVTRLVNIRRGIVPKLTTEQVRSIKTLHSTGLSQRAIAPIFSVHRGTVRAIVEGRTWKDVA